MSKLRFREIRSTNFAVINIISKAGFEKEGMNATDGIMDFVFDSVEAEGLKRHRIVDLRASKSIFR